MRIELLLDRTPRFFRQLMADESFFRCQRFGIHIALKQNRCALCRRHDLHGSLYFIRPMLYIRRLRHFDMAIGYGWQRCFPALWQR